MPRWLTSRTERSVLLTAVVHDLHAESAAMLHRLALAQPFPIDLHLLALRVYLVILVMLLVMLLVTYLLVLHELRPRQWRLPQGSRAGPGRRTR